MEEVVFHELAAEMSLYVEIRLHTDYDSKESEEYQALKVRLTDSIASPIYVIVDPGAPEKVLAKFEGADLLSPRGARFREFLKANAR